MVRMFDLLIYVIAFSTVSRLLIECLPIAVCGVSWTAWKHVYQHYNSVNKYNATTCHLSAMKMQKCGQSSYNAHTLNACRQHLCKETETRINIENGLVTQKVLKNTTLCIPWKTCFNLSVIWKYMFRLCLDCSSMWRCWLILWHETEI